MVYRGRVKKGHVVLDDATGLADGTEVTVRLATVKRKAKAKQPAAARTPRLGLIKFAGKAKGLPPDASRNVDHYLYGHPKQ